MLNFSDVFNDCTSDGTKIKTEDYLQEGKYAIIDQGQKEIAGYTNREDGVYTDVPAIIFGDHTRVIKYVNQPFYLGADGVKLLKSKLSDANYKYLYYALKNYRIPNTGYNRHFKWLKQAEIEYPSKEIQNKVVIELDKITTIIQMKNNQLAELDNLIKSRFIEMFGDPISNSKGLETTDLINVVKLQRGYDLPVQDRVQDGDIPVFGSNGALDNHNEAKVIGGGVITGRSGSIGKVYYTEEDYWPLNTSLFSVDLHGNNIVYLAYLLELFDLSRFADGTGVPTLNRNNVHNKQIINVPVEEQIVFADFVKQVNKSKFD